MIRTLVVEDDELAARAHAEYVRRLPQFTVVGVARTGAAALHEVTHQQVDLVLLDMNLPDLHGLEVHRIMRARGVEADVIAVTSARDLTIVRGAVANGVAQYLLKPFTFATLRDRLTSYAEFRQQVNQASASGGEIDQRSVDRLLGDLRGGSTDQQLPKGMSPESLERVIGTLRASENALTALGAAEAVGMSRVGVRRYLEYLVETGLAARGSRYGGAGRPEIEYRWRGAP
ncbi:response regulator [Kineosporia succinea]|uniref:Transcriptional regulatory protein n=1 Tax=Kineosporia succinea TaxID=84632 RepID=A0ABT9P1I0_9ACTN|nr:response regulator [Kineosporia succinea]MDP9826528.1 response regulator of citrate/malate metabolism [Kineosporia succinea]